MCKYEKRVQLMKDDETELCDPYFVEPYEPYYLH